MASKYAQNDADTRLPKDEIASARHAEALEEARLPYGHSGSQGLFGNSYTTLYAVFAAIGGMVFGYDQGVVSIVLVMPSFLERFKQVSDIVCSGVLERPYDGDD